MKGTSLNPSIIADAKTRGKTLPSDDTYNRSQLIWHGIEGFEKSPSVIKNCISPGRIPDAENDATGRNSTSAARSIPGVPSGTSSNQKVKSKISEGSSTAFTKPTKHTLGDTVPDRIMQKLYDLHANPEGSDSAKPWHSTPSVTQALVSKKTGDLQKFIGLNGEKLDFKRYKLPNDFGQRAFVDIVCSEDLEPSLIRYQEGYPRYSITMSWYAIWAHHDTWEMRPPTIRKIPARDAGEPLTEIYNRYEHLYREKKSIRAPAVRESMPTRPKRGLQDVVGIESEATVTKDVDQTSGEPAAKKSRSQTDDITTKPAPSENTQRHSGASTTNTMHNTNIESSTNVFFEFISFWHDEKRKKPLTGCNTVAKLFLQAQLADLAQEGASMRDMALTFTIPGHKGRKVSVFHGDEDDFDRMKQIVLKAGSESPDADEFVVQVRLIEV